MNIIQKNIITLVFIMILFSLPVTLAIAQTSGQWEILNNEAARIFALDFINEDVGWAVSSDSSLLKTEDGGDTWKSIDCEFEISAIEFLTEEIGWVFGRYSESDSLYILKTTDGGENWISQKALEFHENHGFSSIDDSCFIAWYGVKIFKVYDNGTIWEDISSGIRNCSLVSISFLDRNVGIASYSRDNSDDRFVIRTFDGGEIWAQKATTDIDNITDFHFVNGSIGYFLMENKDGQHCICVTDDTLDSWTIKYKTDYWIESIYALDINTVLAIMNDGSTANIYKSTDGGDTWIKKQKIPGGHLNFNTRDIGFIMIPEFGVAGAIFFRSTDGGESWKILNISDNWTDILFIDKNKGFICGGAVVGGWHSSGGSSGVQYSTIDGGKTWNIDISTDDPIESIEFINDNVGYIISENTFYKSTDSGANWTIVWENDDETNDYDFSGNDLSFINEEIGWVAGSCGRGAGLLETTNGGDNWHLVWCDQNSDFVLNSIHKVGTEVWAVGEGGLMVKYSEQDKWQTLPSITDLPLNDVFFSDENHGWISGGYFDEDNVHLVLLRTINGGETWTEIRDLPYQINDIFFENNLHGWAVGNDTISVNDSSPGHGVILETSDGGDSWRVQVEGLSYPLEAIHFKGGYGWAIGKCLILKYDGVTWIDQNSHVKRTPILFKLYQNYPNPFNPVTMINYQLPMTNDVELSIYNLLGQKVATLVDKRQQAGYHQVEWDASGFANEMYYYRIQTGEFQDVKKMILLR